MANTGDPNTAQHLLVVIDHQEAKVIPFKVGSMIVRMTKSPGISDDFDPMLIDYSDRN